MTPAEYKTQSATQEVNSQGNVNMYVVFKVQTLNGPVAQLVRAPPCHGGGREFESLLGRYNLAVMN